MREFLNENTLYGTIAMIIQEHVGTILVVEGQYDKLALQGHSERGLEILPGFGGREHITRVAKIAEERGLGRVRFLVDRDYDPYITDSPKRPSNMMVSGWCQSVEATWGSPASSRAKDSVGVRKPSRRRGRLLISSAIVVR